MDGATPIAVVVVQWKDQVLVGQRLCGTLSGYDEFPGGKVESGETPQQAAERECREESGLEVHVQRCLETCTYAYAHGPVELHFFLATPTTLEPAPKPPFHWVSRNRLRDLHFPPANDRVLRLLLDER